MVFDDNLNQILNNESEIEKLRKANIAKHADVFKQLFPDGVPQTVGKPRTKAQRQRNPSRKLVVEKVRRSISRSCKGRGKRFFDDDDDHYEREDDNSDAPSTKIRFPFKRKAAEEEEGDFIEEEIKKRKAAPVLRPYDEVREEDLILVAEKTSDKMYDALEGTTCHQCRQKTDDLKTVCRSKGCFGVRGQFCGPCLRNRYGECAKEAIMNREWMCPPCRGICNCSFCMKKRGKRATGILIHTAKEQGYGDVKSFLGDK